MGKCLSCEIETDECPMFGMKCRECAAALARIVPVIKKTVKKKDKKGAG